MKRTLLFIATTMLLVSCALFSKKEYAPGKTFESSAELERFLSEREWRFELLNVTGRYVPTNFNPYGFGFEIKGDSIDSYLPFFGVSYRAPISRDDGPLTFQGKIIGYEISPGREDDLIVEIYTDQESGNKVTYLLNAFPNGSATVSMTSSDTQSLHFIGAIHELRK